MNNIIYIGKYSLIEGFQSAGAKRVLYQIKYLKDYFDILVLTFSPNKSNYNFNINLKTNEHKSLIDLIRLLFYWPFIFWKLIKRKKEKNYLILESVVELYSSVPIFFAKLLGYKIIHDVVEDFSFETNKTRNQKLTSLISNCYEKNITKYCSGLIVISQGLQLKFKHTYLPIAKLYNSVDSQDCVNLPTSPATFNIFYSGSFNSKDGVLDLIDAFELVLSKRKNIHLNLVGKGYGEYYQKCLWKIEGNEYITYLGFLPESEMKRQLKSSHILCVTRTNSEFANNGFPYKLAEYMSFGIPVLTTTVSDIPLIFKDRDTVFFAKPESIDSIAETLKVIIENYNHAIEVGKKGRIYCQRYFSINRIGTQLKNFIENVK